MVLDATKARGALTGARYIKSLRDGREVWLDGATVDVTTHPAFAGVLGEPARLYDLQHDDEHRDRLTYIAPESDTRRSIAYLTPTTPEELGARRAGAELWFEESFGQMSHLPVATADLVLGLYDARDLLGGAGTRFAANAERYFRYAAEHDLWVTHGYGDPQRDGSGLPIEDPGRGVRVVEERGEGIVVRGVVRMAGPAAIAHELIVHPTVPLASPAQEDEQQIAWFAVPMAAGGVKVLCRLPDPTGGNRSAFAGRFDEPDALVILDDVLVPWERVFLLHDAERSRRLLHERIRPWLLYTTQVRFLARVQTFIGLATMVAEANGVEPVRGVRDKLGELITYGEMVRVTLRGIEHNATRTPSGLICPSQAIGPAIFSAQFTERVVEILRDLGGTGLIMQPSEGDLASPELRPYLDRYLNGTKLDTARTARLLRLAWGLVGDSTGARQELHERWLRGDIVQLRNELFAAYDRSEIVGRIREMVTKPLPIPEGGWVPYQRWTTSNE
ncbi:MAG: 4-hydroxyphenylacetate 3-hydroxylase N-terminal domain-containing protein [Dehalococcoidia bacterium]